MGVLGLGKMDASVGTGWGKRAAVFLVMAAVFRVTAAVLKAPAGLLVMRAVILGMPARLLSMPAVLRVRAAVLMVIRVIPAVDAAVLVKFPHGDTWGVMADVRLGGMGSGEDGDSLVKVMHVKRKAGDSLEQ